MADGMPNPTAAPPAMPVAGAGTPPGQPPFGASPATPPTPNAGFQAAGKAKLALSVRIIESALSELGVGTDEGRDALKALQTLSKHVAPGSVPPGVEMAMLNGLIQKVRQGQAQVAQMRAVPAQQPPAQPAAA